MMMLFGHNFKFPFPQQDSAPNRSNPMDASFVPRLRLFWKQSTSTVAHMVKIIDGEKETMGWNEASMEWNEACRWGVSSPPSHLQLPDVEGEVFNGWATPLAAFSPVTKGGDTKSCHAKMSEVSRFAPTPHSLARSDLLPHPPRAMRSRSC